MGELSTWLSYGKSWRPKICMIGAGQFPRYHESESLFTKRNEHEACIADSAAVAAAPVRIRPERADADPRQQVTQQPAVRARALDIDGARETTVRDNLSTADPKDKVHLRSPCHHYEVKLLAGVYYKIDLTSAAFNSFLRLEDAAGKELASDDNGGGGLNARIIFRARRRRRFVSSPQATMPGTAWTF